MDLPGIHELTYHAIMKCDPDCLKELSSNIILSGGSSIYSGMIERLTKELNSLAPNSIRPKVIAPPERRFSVWIGGSILASLNTF